LSEQERKSGVVLVDIGSGTTEIVIYYKSIVRHIAVLPFAGDIITADVEQGCNVSNEHAEELKVKFGSAMSSEVNLEEVVSVPGINGRKPKLVSIKNLSIIIEERLKEIAAMVVAEITRSGYGNRLSCGIVVTGGSVQMPYITELFEKVTGRDVRMGYPNENLGKSITEEIKNPMYATAVGLVWNGFKAIDEREDSYKELRRYAPAPKIVVHSPTPPQSLHNGKPRQEKEKPTEKPSGGWSLMGSLKRLGGRILGEDLGESDKYE
jgi:cell division protein FtsA